MPSKFPLQKMVTRDSIERQIYIVRGEKVMLDSDLAELYGVETRTLNQAVKRNRKRFPEDFIFRLSISEARELLASRSQTVTLKRGQNIKYAPYVFTEHGAVMLASVLNSPVAIAASIQVVRAFVRLRSILAAHKELAKKLEALEKKTDAKFQVVFELIKKYIEPKSRPLPKIGYRTDKDK
jgi:phage regulator Rha-like protein